MNTLTLQIPDIVVPKGTPVIIYGQWLRSLPDGSTAPLHKATVADMVGDTTLSNLKVDLELLLDNLLITPVTLNITDVSYTEEGIVLIHSDKEEVSMGQIKQAIREYIITVLANSVAADIAVSGLTQADKDIIDIKITEET